MSKVAFLGLGAMGARMAANLVKAGHAVTVWNRSPAATADLKALGATVAPSPRAAAAGADFVIAMVADDTASRAVWLDDKTGALAGLDPEAVAIECSTLSPAWAAQLAAAVTATGAGFLEAPVVGTLPQAQDGKLIILAGGEVTTFETARPALAPLAAAIHHVGPVGRGAVMKLAVNGLLGIQLAAWAEMLGFLGKAGVDGAAALDVLTTLPVASPAAATYARLMQAGDFAVRFPIDLMTKDFRYGTQAADALKADTPVADATLSVLERAREAGHGAENISALIRLYTGG
ncbi:NAD(P)-dependent oxidoreductase [Nitrospirillum sp. BR 11828]|uniref:NAD(P)-dependent oxidoreductase n=1 Tax=Nitrospirillum sp. BR 11828 TaxID=3104325 RepID=UPI002ACA3305|nr:NAD(P)-dependent oxidoreductase [Nitrospirillum sp. BR 11828]MDZ5646646.1 NAD(P)-dependent oxidoreductase [Nitrospirillum sp. BR 11828]